MHGLGLGLITEPWVGGIKKVRSPHLWLLMGGAKVMKEERRDRGKREGDVITRR